MCHRTSRQDVLELPPSCRNMAERMEQTIRAEENAVSPSPVAELSSAANTLLTSAEEAIGRELDRDIVLVAYEGRRNTSKNI